MAALRHPGSKVARGTGSPQNGTPGILIQFTPNCRLTSGILVKFYSIARREADSEANLRTFLSTATIPPTSASQSPLPNPTPLHPSLTRATSRHAPLPNMHLLSNEAPKTPVSPNASPPRVLSPLGSCWSLPCGSPTGGPMTVALTPLSPPLLLPRP